MSNINHEYTNEIVCPWCGYEFSDSWEMGDGNEGTERDKCPECEKEFYATRNITINYTTEKAEYGTCLVCGKKDVVIESGWSGLITYSNLCYDCIKRAEEHALKKFFK